jgi:hypothetical protein
MCGKDKIQNKCSYMHVTNLHTQVQALLRQESIHRPCAK